MKCENCGLRSAQEPHPCPYKLDVGNADDDDETLWCNCCYNCQSECADDI
jgi:hypothetical protein